MAVKPHDPRAVVKPEKVEQDLAEILNEDAEGLAAEAEQLERAHAVLRAALQEN